MALFSSILSIVSILVFPITLGLKLAFFITAFHWILHMVRQLFELFWAWACYALAYHFPIDISGANFGKWAIITGGTQSIGKAYSEALAKKGKNLFILSRTVSKMQDLKEELEMEHGIEVDYLSVDFGLPVETYLTKLQEKLHEIRHDGTRIADDIAILINCVGQLPYAYDTIMER